MLEDMFHSFMVSLFVWGEDEEVVHINDKPSFRNHVSEGIVHELLECCGRVGEPKEHYCWFEEAFVCDEGGLPLVAVFDANIVIAPADVKFGEEFGVLELVNEVQDKWEQIGILSSVLI